MSLLVVMGSGETAPTMLPVHREVLARTPPGPAVMLDTPFAFQLNRDELVARAQLYFAQSVGRDVEVVAWPPRDGEATDAERALALLDRATWVFAGPGSPTYALKHWRDTPLPAALTSVVKRGGTLVLGSAAAVTLGSHAVPVYEIYKVGAEPAWVPGLDLLAALTGVSAAVIPHFDNHEGATHDTRFCYLGEERLVAMERDLPDEVGVLGVDEHTAALLDVAGGRLDVLGNGSVSVRRRGDTTTLRAGDAVSFDRLVALLHGAPGAGTPDGAVTPASARSLTSVASAARPPAVMATSLHEEADRARAAFDAGLARRDVASCVQAVLDLEDAIAAWSADTLQSSDRDDARRVLRALVVRLGELATDGTRDPREVLGPYVELLLRLRGAARAARDFTTSDLIREELAKLAVEVRDTSSGMEWTLPEQGANRAYGKH